MTEPCGGVAGGAPDDAGEVGRVAEAAAQGNLGDGGIGFAEEAEGFAGAQTLEVGDRGHAVALPEVSKEGGAVALQGRSEMLDTEIRIVKLPVQQACGRIVVGGVGIGVMLRREGGEAEEDTVAQFGAMEFGG